MGRALGWWDDPDELERRYAQHGSWAKLARATGVPESTLKSARQRQRTAAATEAEPASDAKQIIVDVDHIDDLDDLLRERGLRREDWIIGLMCREQIRWVCEN